MKRAPRDPEPAKRWLTFLHNHREAIAAMDFFTVPSITFRKVIVSHGASDHGLPALRRVPGNKWLDTAMVRVNHKERDSLYRECRPQLGLSGLIPSSHASSRRNIRRQHKTHSGASETFRLGRRTDPEEFVPCDVDMSSAFFNDSEDVSSSRPASPKPSPNFRHCRTRLPIYR
jgi:hypothetical protein